MSSRIQTLIASTQKAATNVKTWALAAPYTRITLLATAIFALVFAIGYGAYKLYGCITNKASTPAPADSETQKQSESTNESPDQEGSESATSESSDESASAQQQPAPAKPKAQQQQQQPAPARPAKPATQPAQQQTPPIAAPEPRPPTKEAIAKAEAELKRRQPSMKEDLERAASDLLSGFVRRVAPEYAAQQQAAQATQQQPTDKE